MGNAIWSPFFVSSSTFPMEYCTELGLTECNDAGIKFHFLTLIHPPALEYISL